MFRYTLSYRVAATLSSKAWVETKYTNGFEGRVKVVGSF
jgi:hypothetical protein